MSQIDTALDIMLHQGRSAHEVAGKIYGVVPALVLQVHDTKGPKRHKMAMVEVFFPWLQVKSDPALIKPWVRWSSPDAGGGVGLYSVPQIGDEVCVAFEQGDPHSPYILGSLWNGQNTIPAPVTDKDGTDCPGNHPGAPTHKTPDLAPTSLVGDGGKNKTYFWRSRTGNLVIMDDDKGTVRIVERSGQSVVQLEGKQIMLLQKEGKGIFCYAQKTIRFDCTNFEVHAGNNMWLRADGDWHIKGDQHVTMDCGATFHSKSGLGTHLQTPKDINAFSKEGVDVNSNLAMNAKASAKDMKCESGAKFEAMSNLGTDMGTKANLMLKAGGGADFSTLMELSVQASGNVNAKASLILMN